MHYSFAVPILVLLNFELNILILQNSESRLNSFEVILADHKHQSISAPAIFQE